MQFVPAKPVFTLGCGAQVLRALKEKVQQSEKPATQTDLAKKTNQIKRHGAEEDLETNEMSHATSVNN